MKTQAPCGWLLIIAAATTLLGYVPAGPARATPSDQAAPSSHSSHDATTHHSFEDVEHWVSLFDDPARDAWQKPASVVEALQLRPGMCVADLGAGTGYFSRYLAAAVGEAGTVFAVDIVWSRICANVPSASARRTSYPSWLQLTTRACRLAPSMSC